MFAALPRMQGRLLDAVIKRLRQKPIRISGMPQSDTTKVDGGSVQRATKIHTQLYESLGYPTQAALADALSANSTLQSSSLNFNRIQTPSIPQVY